MYLAHFGFREPPFALTPDPYFLYMSRRHREGLAHLLYGLEEGGGFIQLTGEVGTGKTTLGRCLLQQIPENVDVAYVLNPRLTAIELLATLCDQLKIRYPAKPTQKVVVDALYTHLVKAHEHGRRTILIIDEAQNLSCDILEQIRLLTNLETTTKKLLQIILIGQPELVKLLDRKDLRQVAQRITARYHLLPFSEGETKAYIKHRIEIAGGNPNLFPANVCRWVHRYARGIPRLINVFCDRALLGAFVQDKATIDTKTVKRAVAEVMGMNHPLGLRIGPWRTAVAALAITGMLGGTGIWWLTGHSGPLVTHQSSTPSPKTPRPTIEPAVTVKATEPSASKQSVATPVSLISLLSDPALRTDQRSALDRLVAFWRLSNYTPVAGDTCKDVRIYGLQCLWRRGDWHNLRVLNLPVVIELLAADGSTRYAILDTLGETRATLIIDGKPYTYPLQEIEPLRSGRFIALWKPPAFITTPIRPGSKGLNVVWLRQRLSAFDGIPIDTEHPELFTEELRKRVVSFQQDHLLIPDGIVGQETVLHLVSEGNAPELPKLNRS
ncbi:MAG TPA: AAA family ATPase [Gammaproteobacteria bacterium]|nr:AAA family ATPase [Gammaproteobacteria bacterium]